LAELFSFLGVRGIDRHTGTQIDRYTGSKLSSYDCFIFSKAGKWANPSDKVCIMIDVAIPSERNVMKQEAEEDLKCNNLRT
jgi:hypothetical protein